MPKQTLRERLKHAWNAFANRDPTDEPPRFYGAGTYARPDRPHFSAFGRDKSIITSIYTRIGIDCAAIDIKHVRLDENDCFKDEIKSGLNDCLSVEANKDQTGRAFVQDIVMSMCDEGCVAVVPVDTSSNPKDGSYDIDTMRVGKITQWYPDQIKVRLYNDRKGRQEEITVWKSNVAIVENPLYPVMNEPNSTLKRLQRKINLLDSVDEQQGSNKMDLIVQLPYVIKTEARRQQAEKRRKDIELQLASSEYGIAYTDGTEKITQLNKAIESHLQEHVDKLTEQLYAQLGLTPDVFNGTADEKVMLNYYNRTIEPIMSAITLEFTRKFLTKTARTQGQSIKFFRDPFRLTPVSDLAEIADKFTRNAIVTSNEFRAIVGFKPSDDPMANELINNNLYPTEQQEMQAEAQMAPEEGMPPEEGGGNADYMQTPMSEVHEQLKGIQNGG